MVWKIVDKMITIVLIVLSIIIYFGLGGFRQKDLKSHNDDTR